jgi:hypothetical protein
MNVYLILSSILLLTNLKQKCSSQLAEQISNTRKSGLHFEKRREKRGWAWAYEQACNQSHHYDSDMPDAGRDCVRSDSAIAGYLLPAQATADMMMSRSPILLEKTGCVNACTVLACKKTQLDTSQTVCHP